MGRDHKLFKKRFRLNVRKYAFSNRVIDNWNLLSANCVNCSTFYSARSARIASAVLATAIPSVRLSVRPSVRLSATRQYCVKTTARSTVQFAPLDSKMCLVL